MQIKINHQGPEEAYSAVEKVVVEFILFLVHRGGGLPGLQSRSSLGVTTASFTTLRKARAHRHTRGPLVLPFNQTRSRCVVSSVHPCVQLRSLLDSPPSYTAYTFISSSSFTVHSLTIPHLKWVSIFLLCCAAQTLTSHRFCSLGIIFFKSLCWIIPIFR